MVNSVENFSLGNTAQLKPRLLAQAPVALPRRFTEILCPDVVVLSRQYTKYYRKTAPSQCAKFTRKSLLFNYAVLPFFLLFFERTLFDVRLQNVIRQLIQVRRSFLRAALAAVDLLGGHIVVGPVAAAVAVVEQKRL